ncbi:MAG: diphosphomevalonate decarboxylase [Spirochaetales bacterium]|nr:diphosphomevalonate decarboxylase [Spirochaetales bacterium]
MNLSDQPILGTAKAIAHPSLAMVKYWGKAHQKRNIPAVPSLALTLDQLKTETQVKLLPKRDSDSQDEICIEGQRQPLKRFAPFLSELRQLLAKKNDFPPFILHAESQSNFPTAAGLASSASGFAALALGALHASGLPYSRQEASALARIGSASAARSLWGGFVRLDAHGEAAEQVHPSNHWPQLRVLVVQVSAGKKSVSSREAMESSRLTSPFYEAWVADAPHLFQKALTALEHKNLAQLGEIMLLSYQRMFATMSSASPPLLYWKAQSLEIIHACAEWRKEGLPLWETMDAGPQIKIFYENGTPVPQYFADRFPSIPTRICGPGADAEVKTL